MAEATSSLALGPLRLPLIEGPQGPAVDPQDGWLKPVAWALRLLADPEEGEALRAAVRSGQAVYEGPIEIRAPSEGDDVEAGRTAWRERTGAELNDPVVLVAVASSAALLPRSGLVDAAERLVELRASTELSPPWLFRPDPRADRPHPSEREALLAFEASPNGLPASTAELELARLGLTSREHWEAKLRALYGWGATKLSKRYLERIRAQDPAEPPAPPWLFRRDSYWDLAHPSERALVAELDREAEAIDEVERSLDDAAEPPELIAHRSRYLQRLDDAGLLSPAHKSTKLRVLRRWNAERLTALYQAALRGLDYLTSPERAKYNPDAKETDLLSAPVCLDIYRGLRTPENVSTFQWISWGEHLLRTHGPGPDVQADQGDFPYHDSDGLVIVLWRKDAGIPALRYVALEPPVIDTSLIREWLA